MVLKKILASSLFLIVLAVLLSGCSDRTVLGNLYIYPEFLSNGQIMAVRGIKEERFNNIGMRNFDAYEEYLTRMAADGSGEIVGEKVTNDIVSDLNYSPVSTWAAYASGKGGGKFNQIIVRYYPPVAGARADTVILNTPNATSFDWDPAGNGLVYSNTDGEIHAITLTGTDTLLLAAASVESVAYKYGARIAFTYRDGIQSKVAAVDNNGANRINTGVAGVTNLCISKAMVTEVHGLQSGAYIKLDLNTFTTTSLIVSFSGNGPRLAPTSDKVVFEKDSALYTQDLVGGAAVKIK
jgi:hypothetical protein